MLKDWSQRTSNHALPKLVSSKNIFIRVIWALLFLLAIWACATSIYYDTVAYIKDKVNTKLNVTQTITAESPTISICVDTQFRVNSNFSVILFDCEIKRGRYFEIEKCGIEDFYRHPNNQCLTFNTSFQDGKPLSLSPDSQDVGMKFTFKNNETDIEGIFLIIHEPDKMPLKPQYDNHYVDLFACKSLNAKTDIIYAISSRRHTLKLHNSKCVEDWNSINKKIAEKIPDYLLNEYNEDACFSKCLDFHNDTECKSFCPVKCDSETQIVTETRNCIESEDDNISSVTVILREAYINIIEEAEAMSFRKLIGAIGGRLSLALGMSLISFIDFIEGAVWLLKIIFKCNKRVEATEEHPAEIEEKTIKMELKEWCLNSNIHGVSRIVLSKHFILKIIWFIAVISSFIYVTITLNTNFSIYYNYDVRSTYSIERSLKTYYPAMTFCSYEDLKNDSIFIEKRCYDSKEDVLFSSEDMAFKRLANLNCYTLNFYMNDTKTLASVSSNGNYDSCRFSFRLQESSTIALVIHNQSFMPPIYNEIEITRGQEVSIGITTLYRNMLPKPYSNCVNNWDSIDKDLYNFYKNHKYYHYRDFDYEEIICYDFCLLKSIAKKCNVEFIGDLYENYAIFRSTCFQDNKSNIDFKACQLKCPTKCNSMKYAVKTGIATIAPDDAVFYVYYDESNYHQITDEPILSIDELIASIGGQFGLCIGMSLLSLIDLIFLLFHFLFILIRKRKH